MFGPRFLDHVTVIVLRDDHRHSGSRGRAVSWPWMLLSICLLVAPEPSMAFMLEDVRCVAPEVAADYPAWSTDGTRIAVDDGDRLGIRVIRLTDDSVIVLGTPHWNDPSWAPRRDLLAFVDKAKGGLYTTTVSTPDSERVLVRGWVEGYSFPWSPDGKLLLFRRAGSLFVVSSAGGTPRMLLAGTEPGAAVTDARFSQDGSQIYAERGEDFVRLAVRTNKLSSFGPVSPRYFAISPAGEPAAYVISKHGELVSVRSDGAMETTPLERPGIGIDVNPGTRDVVLGISQRGLFVLPRAQRQLAPIRGDPTDRFPRWAPAGDDRLAFIRGEADHTMVCVARVANDGDER